MDLTKWTTLGLCSLLSLSLSCGSSPSASDEVDGGGENPSDASALLDAPSADAAPSDASTDAGSQDATSSDAAPTLALAAEGVLPLYTDIASWNDYVDNDGTNFATATGAQCPGTGKGYRSCLHSGEIRSIGIPNETVCASLSATDSLGAFVWHCDDSTAGIRMVSSGLAQGVLLSDLLDLSQSPPVWREISVTVSDGVAQGSSGASVWWDNPIVLNDADGILSGPGTVFVVNTEDPLSYSMAQGGIALVATPDVTIRVVANNKKFLWFEGNVSAGGIGDALNWNRVSHSVLRGVHASSAGATGIHLLDATNNYISDTSSVGNAEHGFHLELSQDNSFENIAAANNNDYGMYLQNSSSRNIIAGFTASNNGRAGMISTSGIDTLATNISFANNGADGLFHYLSPRSVFANLSAIHNADSGVRLFSSEQSAVLNLASVNNGASGVLLQTSADATLGNAVLAHSGTSGIDLVGTTALYATGLLKVGSNTGNDCSASTSSGIANNTCIPQGASDFTISTAISLATSLVGSLSSNDSVNGSDTDGIATSVVSGSSDWYLFDNLWRSWMPTQLQSPLQSAMRGACSSNCRIFDFAAASGDVGDNGGASILDVHTLPGGDDARYLLKLGATQEVCELLEGAVWEAELCSGPGYLTQETCEGASHTWSTGLCAVFYLKNATERMSDGIGNDNTLCESGETCVFAPNIGSYQGHGELIDAGAIADGIVSGVTLLRYSQNGF